MKSLWKEWSDNGIRLPLLAAAAIMLALVTVMGILGYRNWDLSSRNEDLAGSLADMRRKEADCTAAIKAGTDFLLAANNFDYRQPEKWTQQLVTLTVGPMNEYFSNAQVAQDSTSLIKEGKLRKSSTVADAACAVQTEAKIRVVAQLDEQTLNFQIQDPVKTTSAVWVEVTKEDGSWRAYDSGRGDQSLVGNATATQPVGPPSPENPILPEQPR